MGVVLFETEDGVLLEGEIRHPEVPPEGSAVLCHAHSRHGGSKDHPLLWALRRELASRGLVVLAFNFRGIMGSEGSYSGGTQEVLDVRAAVTRVRVEAVGPTLVCGWSFGAHVALRTAVADDRIAALALIGFPLGNPDIPLPPLPERRELSSFVRPVLLLAGEADQFCPLPEMRGLSRRLPRVTAEVIRGTDHFFWRREREAAERVGRFAAEALHA